MATKRNTGNRSGDGMTDEIRKKAYELFETSGKKPGRDLDNWLEAERIVKQRMTLR